MITEGLQTSGYVHVQDPNVWNIAFNDTDTLILYLGVGIANISPLFWAQRFWHVSVMSEKRRQVQQSAAEELQGFEISLRDQGMSRAPLPPLNPSGGRRHQLSLSDERTQSSLQTNEGRLFSLPKKEKNIFVVCYEAGKNQRSLTMSDPRCTKLTFTGTVLHALQPPSICIWSTKKSSWKCSLHSSCLTAIKHCVSYNQWCSNFR